MSMARKVWKFQIPQVGHPFVLELPGPSKVVHVSQRGVPWIWAECQPGWPIVARTFQVFATGAPIPDDVEHVGTYEDGPFVWHVYGRFE